MKWKEYNMEFTLKMLHGEAVPRALEKAERYRLLNDPTQAESICRDILAIAPDHQDALVALLLSLTEQFSDDPAPPVRWAKELLPRIADEYRRTYFTGIVSERRGRAQLKRGTPGCGSDAYEWLREAMTWFEKAETIRPPGNDDSILRWNGCARTINAQGLKPSSREDVHQLGE